MNNCSYVYMFIIFPNITNVNRYIDIDILTATK